MFSPPFRPSVLAAATAAVLAGCAGADADAASDASAGALAVGGAGAAFAGGDTAAAEPAPPPLPRRAIVDDVEVVVNIPSGRLQLFRGDSLVRSYPVSVGSARYATPVGSFLLATVVWNPWWRPPPGSDWARNRKPEPPGSANPMGRVKLHMDELVFIHGTTSEGRLGEPASHGCIRMSNADVVDLARRLNRIAEPDIRETRLDSLAAPGREERRTVMARTIRMRVEYRVAEVKGERLHVYPDVYGRVGAEYASRVRLALARSGVDTTQVPAAAMARLQQGAARGGASFALAEVPSLRPLPPAPPRERGPQLLGRPVDSVPAAAPEPGAPEAVTEPSPPEP